ncbi:hypothetical protein CQ057_12955 [Ochrobactrum sp. MYb49]|nr:hypothetical protein CQ057_12955 [Ochrobactrum sp. MYb49]
MASINIQSIIDVENHWTISLKFFSAPAETDPIIRSDSIKLNDTPIVCQAQDILRYKNVFIFLENVFICCYRFGMTIVGA